MIQLSDVNNAYVFIHTSNEKVSKRIKKLTAGLKFKQFGSEKLEIVFSGIFYKDSLNAGNNTFYSIEKMNDQADYELDLFKFEKSHQLDKQFDTLISYCFINENTFVAGNDYLSIFNHFYFHDSDTFICSNNMFIVAKLCNDIVSEDALFETLFFRYPYKRGTFFKSVKALKPFQQLCFSIKDGFNLSASIAYNDLLMEGYDDVSKSIDLFFSKLNNPNNLPSLLSFSGGSDSTAILAILKKQRIECQLASFKGHSDWDTYRINNLSKKTGSTLLFIDTELPEDSQDEILRYVFLTNGYSASVKFYEFYKKLKQKIQIFDGYSMMLGDMSDATLYPPFEAVLQGFSLDLVFEKYYSGFASSFLDQMKEYLVANYKDQFTNVNTLEGLQNIRQFNVEFVTGKIYSGVLRCPLNFGHQNVSFYLSRKFISHIHSNGYGIARTCAARADFPGYAVNRKPLAELARLTDKTIYRLKLDHGLSFKDINNNDKLILYKKKFYQLKQAIFVMKNKKPYIHCTKKSTDTSKFDFVSPNVTLNNYALEGLSTVNFISEVYDNI